MSDDDDRTIARGERINDPSSWNGISYDDVMRSLEVALPPEDRATLVNSLPTRPVDFLPMPVQAASPAVAPAMQAGIPTTSVAPVALPSIALHYVDLDADFDPDVEVGRQRAQTMPRRKAKASGRAKAFGSAIGVALSVLIVSGLAGTNATTSDARSFMSRWADSVSAKVSHSTNAATPVAAAPVAAPIAVQPVTTPSIATEPRPIPTMRGPVFPPAKSMKAKAKVVKAHDVDPTDETNDANADPSSLLDRGLGP